MPYVAMQCPERLRTPLNMQRGFEAGLARSLGTIGTALLAAFRIETTELRNSLLFWECGELSEFHSWPFAQLRVLIFSDPSGPKFHLV
jgi:hypothetical protein